MTSSFKHFYEFGPFRLDAADRLLYRGEQPVRLTPKEFDTLLALVRSGGRVMSKDELLKEIWPDTFVEEATLAQNVFTLRKALARGGGDEQAQYVETVPRRGYRFAAKVRERREEISPAETETEAAAFAVASDDARKAEGDKTLAGAFTTEALPPVAPPRARQNGSSSAAVVDDEAAVGTNTKTSEATEATGDAEAAATSDAESAATVQTPPPSSTSQAAHDSSSATTTASARPSDTSGGRPVRAAVLISIAVLLAAVGAVFLVYRFVLRRHVEPRRPAFQTMKVTRLPVTGDVLAASISPDGQYLAYVASEAGAYGIWVRQVGAASNNQRIVPPAPGVFYVGVHFSPDSAHVYYGAVREGQNEPPSLYQVPALGGPSKKILDSVASPVSFSRDGKRLAFTRGDVASGTSVIIADADGSNPRTLARSRPGAPYLLPAWSPGGDVLACVYASTSNFEVGNAYMGVTAFNVSDGAETRLTEERWFGVNQMAWLPDGALILSAAEQELSPNQIWELSYPSGETRRVTNDLNSYVDVSLTADGSALVAVQTDRTPNIWVAPGGDASRARQVTTGTGKFDGFYGVAWTADGRIIYSSAASGGWDIWMMNADGTGQRQLTVGARSNYGPSVSSDGRYVVFVSNRAGPFNVWRMDADGSNPVRLTSGKGENFPHVTPDGQWVVYATIGFAQRNAVWKVPIEGGEPVALTERPASWPFVSPDGKSFVCTYNPAPNEPNKLAVIPVEGGQPTKTFDIEPTFRANTVWLPDNRGIAFLDTRSGTSNVWLQPLSGGKPVQLTDFKSDAVVAYDWSRDNRLVATRSVETTGVVLIRDFR